MNLQNMCFGSMPSSFLPQYSLKTNMVSEHQWSSQSLPQLQIPSPHVLKHLPAIFPVIFHAPSYLLTHFIISHLWKLTKQEKKFNPLQISTITEETFKWKPTVFPFTFGDFSLGKESCEPTQSSREEGTPSSEKFPMAEEKTHFSCDLSKIEEETKLPIKIKPKPAEKTCNVFHSSKIVDALAKEGTVKFFGMHSEVLVNSARKVFDKMLDRNLIFLSVHITETELGRKQKIAATNGGETETPLKSVLQRIQQAAERSGRSVEEIRVVAASKTKPISALHQWFNENYVQEFLQKAPELPDDFEWHFIGNLQSNKDKPESSIDSRKRKKDKGGYCNGDVSLPSSYDVTSARDLRLCKHVHDNVHGNIYLDPRSLKFIDTEQFQRLCELKQLDFTHMVYPGAVHYRFEHSLGVYWLAGQSVEKLKSYQGSELGIDRFDIQIVKPAGLMHDVGHGLFSYLFERESLPIVISGSHWSHEQMSVKFSLVT